MKLNYSVLGKDLQVTSTTIPVISPYWRLKHSGDWLILWQYDPEQIKYSVLSPLMGATLSLLNGNLTFRHLSMILQFAHDFNSLEESETFLIACIKAANKENDAIVNMSDKLSPFIQKYDPLEFLDAEKDENLQTRLAYPLSLNVMFSNNCETNCMYCYAHRRTVPKSHQLSTARWIEIFHEAHTIGIEQISLSGGDPLFRRDALKLIGELIQLRMLFILSTKCHITKRTADCLADMGMNLPVNQFTREIQISMDGPDEHTADILAGSPGYFYRAIDSIKNLVKRGFNFRVKAVVTPLNAPHIYEWIKLLVNMGVNRLSIAAYNRTFFRHTDDLFLGTNDRLLISEQCKHARNDFPDVELILTGLDSLDISNEKKIAVQNNAGELLIEDENHIKLKADRWKNRTDCSGGRSSITITPDGKVVLCDTVPQEGVFIVGDISNQSIIDVWNSNELLKLTYPPREKFMDSPCYDCPERIDCHGNKGYCFRDTYFNYGTIYGPPPKCPFAPDDGMRME